MADAHIFYQISNFNKITQNFIPMNDIPHLLIAAGVLIALSQFSYARIAGAMYGYRDLDTIERLLPLQKRADLIHCIHHAIHAICGCLLVVTAITLITPSMGLPVSGISVAAWSMLVCDALVYVFNDIKHQLCMHRDELKRKWSTEKVFGPEHDNEVTLYRTLNELTTKNLVRDLLHSAAFAVLTFMYL